MKEVHAKYSQCAINMLIGTTFLMTNIIMEEPENNDLRFARICIIVMMMNVHELKRWYALPEEKVCATVSTRQHVIIVRNASWDAKELRIFASYFRCLESVTVLFSRILLPLLDYNYPGTSDCALVHVQYLQLNNLMWIAGAEFQQDRFATWTASALLLSISSTHYMFNPSPLTFVDLYNHSYRPCQQQCNIA